jgi:hypothetical protein
MQAADIFVDGDATSSPRACRSIADSRNFEKSSLALAQSEEEPRRVCADRFHHERHLRELTGCIEPSSYQARQLGGPGFRTPRWSMIMPRAAQLFAPMSATTSASSTRKSGRIPLDPILLFSGIGLLAFLIAVVTGVQGVWY